MISEVSGDAGGCGIPTGGSIILRNSEGNDRGTNRIEQ
jgi:hypothetical protein